MKRRTHSESGSLELLLDTMCNVFGGIILMTILVVIQTQSAAREVHKTEVEATQSLEHRKLQFDVRRLEKQVVQLKIQRLAIERQYRAKATPQIQKALERKDAFEKTLRGAKEQRADLLADVSGLRKAHAKIDRQFKNTDRRISEKESELAKINGRLREVEKLRRKVRLPHRRGRTIGTGRYYLIRGRKAYFIDRILWKGSKRVVGDCVVEPVVGADPPVVKVWPKEGAGVLVGTEDGFNERLKDSIKRDRPGYIVFFVHSDSNSFGTFQTFKNAVVEMGYPYVVGPKDDDNDYWTLVPTQYHEPE